jgi:hypothetical protein
MIIPASYFGIPIIDPIQFYIMNLFLLMLGIGLIKFVLSRIEEA